MAHACALVATLLIGGCALVDQTTFNPEAGRRPTIPQAAVPAAVPPQPGPPALLTVRFPASGDVDADVAKAVAAAKARKPNVVFEVVEIAGPQPGATVGADAATVARMIETHGVPAARVRLSARPTPNPPGREVQVYVR